MVMSAATDPDITRFTTFPPRAGEAAAVDFVELQRRRSDQGDGFPFAVAVADTDVAIGFVGLWMHEPERVFLGYWLAPDGRGRGAAAVCLRRVVEWAIAEHIADDFKLYIEPWNEASIRTAEKAGFTKGAFLPAFRKIGYECRDVFEYSYP